MFGNGSKDEDNMLAEQQRIDSAKQYFMAEIFKELDRARAKFPTQGTLHTLAALTEEIGELNQAIIQYNFEPDKRVDVPEIRKEAIQCIVMVMRVLFDTDLKAK